MEHLDLAGVITSTPMNWTMPLFDQQDAIYLSTSRQMLEPILEETSEDEEYAQNSWNQYHETTATSFWSGSASESDTGSVIRIEVNKDSDSISERDFACPAKRPRRADDFLQYLSGSTQQQYSNNQQLSSLDDTVILRRPQQPRPDFVSESSAGSLERFLALETAARDSFNIQRSSTGGGSRRFDEYFNQDSDNLSYQSLSRSSSLIQFESLERQLLMQDQHASTSSLGNSSPSLLSFDGGVNNTGSGSVNSGSNSGNNSRRGSQSSLLKRYESSDGRLHQTYYDLDKLNFEEEAAEKNLTTSHKQILRRFGSSSRTNVTVEVSCSELGGTTESKSDTESSSSSSDTGSGNSVLNSKKPSVEDLSDAVTSGKSMRMAAFQRGGKNSAENLSEDSGYCEPSNLRRTKSKSIPKNFEKFCEEEEEFGHESALMLHSKNHNNNTSNNMNNNNKNNSKSMDDVDMCQPKIDDVKFIVMESENAAHKNDNAIDDDDDDDDACGAAFVDRSAIQKSTSSSSSSPSPPLETSFDASMYTPLATASYSSPTSTTTHFKNSPPRDLMTVSIEQHQRSHRPTAHSPSPAASDISGTGSSTSTTPSTCASAASFTWYGGDGGGGCMPLQQQQGQQQKYEIDQHLIQHTHNESPAAAKEIFNEFSAQNFPLRSSLPDLREAYGSSLSSENQFLFFKSERPTNGYVLEQHIEGAEAAKIGGSQNFKTNFCDSSLTSPSSPSASASSSSSPSSSPVLATPSTSEQSDVTTEDSPKTSRRRCSIGGCGEVSAISDLSTFGRVSSVPSELNKVGRKKRANQTRQQKAKSRTVDSSESNNSETENQFDFETNSLRRSCSWSERRQKFQEFQAKRRPKSLYGYMNASYQDLTQLDYNTETQKNQKLLKRAVGVAPKEKMSESSRHSSSGAGDYEDIICKGNFLLDELSEIYDRNASILNDQPMDQPGAMMETKDTKYEKNYENEMLLAAKINQKPLHSPRPPPRHQRKHSNSSYSDLESDQHDNDIQHVQLTIRKPPARQKNGRRVDVLSDGTEGAHTAENFMKTFDQDPTNLRTSYAASLEKCNFDAKELSNSELNAQTARAMPKRRFQSQANNAKKKNLVSSTPNLNAYDHGADDEAELDDELCVSSAHTSMHQLPQGGARGQKPLGILLPAGSRTSFSKEVSFCPVVSKYCWQEQSSEELNEQNQQQTPQDERVENEVYDKAEKGDQPNKNLTKSSFAAFDDDDLLCNDIDAMLAYNTQENEMIAAKLYDEASQMIINEFYKKEHYKEHFKEHEEKDIDTTATTAKLYNEEESTESVHVPSEERELCARFIAELRENELSAAFKKYQPNSFTVNDQQEPTTPNTPPPNIITSSKLVKSNDDLSGEQQKTTTIITKRLLPSTSTSNEALANLTAAAKSEVSHKTTFDSARTIKQQSRVSEATTESELKQQNASSTTQSSIKNNKNKTSNTTRPLSIQLPILSEPPVNRAHHILYASQQMLDNFQKRELEEQEQQEKRLKAASVNNLTMSKSQQSHQLSDTSVMVNNNNSLKGSKLKPDEKHPNSKGFLSRFAHGLRFSLRRNKKKQQLQREQQQQQQQVEQQTKTEFLPELQFNVGQKEKKSADKATKSSKNSTKSTTKNDGKRGHSPDVIHIPLKGPLPAGSLSPSNNSSKGNSTFYTSSPNNTSSDISTTSTVNMEYSSKVSPKSNADSQTNSSQQPLITVLPVPKMKLVTGKPPLPKQPPPPQPRSSSLPQNMRHAQQQQQQAAVAMSTSFVSKAPPPLGLPPTTGSCEDFLDAERSYYYDDFKNQLNSGMQANGGCTLNGVGVAVDADYALTSPSRASVSQKTQMFNNMQRVANTNQVAVASQSYQHQQQQQQQMQHQQQQQYANSGKIGLIETNLDTHETIITGKTRSLMDIGPSQLRFVNVGGGKRLNMTSTGAGGVGVGGVISGNGGANNVLIYDDGDDVVDHHGDGGVIIKSTTPAGQIASVRRPHKSMEFLLDKENQKNVLPPENELQKSHENNPAALSEHQLRIQASLQRLNIPDWFRQYNQTQAHSPEGGGGGASGSTYKPGNFTRKRTQESGRWAGLNSKTTSLSSLGSQRSDRSPLLLSPSAHSHHGGQTTLAGTQHVTHTTSAYSTAGGTTSGGSGGAFSRWSTSHLNSTQTSPSVSQRGSFSRGGPINSSFMSVASGGNNSVIRNSFRQPYLGWRSTEKLSQRTAHERLASSLLAQQQRTSPTQRTAANNGIVSGVPNTPEIQSSIKEVTSAIVHYVNDQTNPQRSRSTSPNSRKCWLESSFVGIRPLDSPQTPVIETAPVVAFNVVNAANSFVVTNNSNNLINYNNPLSTTTTNTQTTAAGGIGIPAQSAYFRNNTTTSTGAVGGVGIGVGTTQSTFGLTTNAANVLRMNGLSLSGGAPERSLSSASLEDVLASLLGLPSTSNASGAGLSTSDPYARSTTGDTVSENPMVNYRNIAQQQQFQIPQQPNSNNQPQKLEVDSQLEQQHLRRRSEGDAPKQQQKNATAAATTTTISVTSTKTPTCADVAADGNVLQPRRVSLSDSSEYCNNLQPTTNNASSELQIKCRNTKCDQSASPADAKKYYKSCHNCTHLYCTRECRRAHWEKHRKACLHSRASNLCRQVLATCKDDVDTQRHLSLLARKGFLSQGRGVVRVLFRSAEAAEGFIKHGFQCMGEASYVRWPDLMPAEMGLELYAELLKLSTEYKADSKMLIYVAICVVSEAPGMGQAPVRWERQLVSRCAKLKLCKTILLELEQQQQQQQVLQQQPLAMAMVAVPEPTTEILILTFNPNLRTSSTHRDLILSNILDILSRRGVLLRKHYPEIYQRLQSYTDGQTDKFNPVTLHPRDSQTGQSFVCIIMPVHAESEIIKLPSAADGGNRVTTIDVGSPAALAQLDDDELLTRSTS